VSGVYDGLTQLPLLLLLLLEGVETSSFVNQTNHTTQRNDSRTDMDRGYRGSLWFIWNPVPLNCFFL